MIPTRHAFHEMLTQARTDGNQTVDAMAILLSMSPEEYEALECGKYPDDETLIKLCRMMGWNYHEAQRVIINEMISPHSAPRTEQPSAVAPEHASPEHASKQPAPIPPDSFKKETLNGRLREVRDQSGQSIEIIALMLRIEPETYMQLEAGEPPSDELLRRISLVFHWNYNELKDILVSEQAHSYQPHFRDSPFPGATELSGRFRVLVGDMAGFFDKLSLDDQTMMLAQLELIRDTMRRHQRIAGEG